MLKTKASSLLLVVLALAFSPASAGQPSKAAPIQSQRDAGDGAGGIGVASFDRLVPELMRRWNIPGGAVAVSVVGVGCSNTWNFRN